MDSDEMDCQVAHSDRRETYALNTVALTTNIGSHQDRTL